MQAKEQKRLAAKEERLRKIQQKRVKTLRKLSERRKTVRHHATLCVRMCCDDAPLRASQVGTAALESKRRDIISEYSDYGSDVYAPRTRLGRTADRTAIRTDPVRPMCIRPHQAIASSLPSSSSWHCRR